MKKLMTLALAAIMMLGLVGCGSKKEEQANVDLTGFYNSLATEYG